MKNYRKTSIAIFLIASAFHPVMAGAEDIERGNPFVAPPTWSEEQARLDERSRIIFRQMEPGLTSDIMRRVNSGQSALEIRLGNRIDQASKDFNNKFAAATIAGSQAAEDTATADGGAKPTSIPEGSTFISCVNNEALYRDTNDTLFKIPKEDVQGIDRCAR